MHKACTLSVVLISALGGLCWLSVSLIPFMPLMGIRHSGEVDSLVGAGSVGWLFQLLGDWWVASLGAVRGWAGRCWSAPMSFVWSVCATCGGAALLPRPQGRRWGGSLP
jgi:hypothetical protein